MMPSASPSGALCNAMAQKTAAPIAPDCGSCPTAMAIRPTDCVSLPRQSTVLQNRATASRTDRDHVCVSTWDTPGIHGGRSPKPDRYRPPEVHCRLPTHSCLRLPAESRRAKAQPELRRSGIPAGWMNREPTQTRSRTRHSQYQGPLRAGG